MQAKGCGRLLVASGGMRRGGGEYVDRQMVASDQGLSLGAVFSRGDAGGIRKRRLQERLRRPGPPDTTRAFPSPPACAW